MVKQGRGWKALGPGIIASESSAPARAISRQAESWRRPAGARPPPAEKVIKQNDLKPASAFALTPHHGSSRTRCCCLLVRRRPQWWRRTTPMYPPLGRRRRCSGRTAILPCASTRPGCCLGGAAWPPACVLLRCVVAAAAAAPPCACWRLLLGRGRPGTRTSNGDARQPPPGCLPAAAALAAATAGPLAHKSTL